MLHAVLSFSDVSRDGTNRAHLSVGARRDALHWKGGTHSRGRWSYGQQERPL